MRRPRQGEPVCPVDLEAGTELAKYSAHRATIARLVRPDDETG
jgi:hypothetical protein